MRRRKRVKRRRRGKSEGDTKEREEEGGKSEGDMKERFFYECCD